MIALLRLLLLIPLFFLVCIGGSIFCIFRPFHRNNTRAVAHFLSALHPLLGIKLQIINNDNVNSAYNVPSVFIANHQNTYDLFTISAAVIDSTVSIGKKSIRWIPFFGQLYWLSGNILIDRNNKSSAKATIDQVSARISNDKVSIWMFPEGTRSNGKGLLPFKLGAFNTAIQAGVPIIPIIMSTTTDIKLNRLNNGHVLIEILDPISTDPYELANAKELAQRCHQLMLIKAQQLDQKVSHLNNS
jgi:1-acyl-sn-glycerol-3-phosphate acyltransferase